MYMRQGREGIECIKYMFICVEGDIYVCVCIYICTCIKNVYVSKILHSISRQKNVE